MSGTPPSTGPAPAPIRVLMVTATAGFRHDSIATAHSVVANLAASRSDEFAVTATENLADLTAARLAATDMLMFALTSGELALDDTQKRAMMDFVTAKPSSAFVSSDNWFESIS